MKSMSDSRCGAFRSRRACAALTRMTLALASLSVVLATTGCSSSGSNGDTGAGMGTASTGASTAPGASSSPSASNASKAADETDARLAVLRSQLDVDLLAGPTATDALGYRTLWQTRVETAGGSTLRGSQCNANEVFVWDSIGVVTRLRPASGDTIWQAASSSRVDRILSVFTLETRSGKALAALVTDTQAFFFDASNGIFASRQGFSRMANTGAILDAPFFIYGTQAGQLVWHDFEVGSESHVTQLDGQVRHAPRLAGEVVVAAGSGGTVGAFSARNGRLLWARSLNAGIVARPAADDRAIWVPSNDQYFTCLSIRTGRTLWRYFSQAPMTQSPTLLEDAVYLQLPGEGLLSFDSIPLDKFDGVVRWRSPETVGDVIGVCRAGLLAWDLPSRTLTLLEERTGSVIRRFVLAGAVDLKMTDPIDGDVVITGLDGRVQRLTPIARRAAAKS